MLNYVIQQGESQNYEEFLNIIIERNAKYKEETMTIAEQLENKGYQKGIYAGIEQGLQQGLKQGIEKGIEKGEHEKALAIAKAMLSEHFDLDTIKKMTGLSSQHLSSLIKKH